MKTKGIALGLLTEDGRVKCPAQGTCKFFIAGDFTSYGSQPHNTSVDRVSKPCTKFSVGGNERKIFRCTHPVFNKRAG